MNKKLKRQIKAYAGIAGGVLSAGKLNAQVNYVDVIPDTLIELTANCCTLSFPMDIDNNLSQDFIMEIEASTSTIPHSEIEIFGFNNNEILGDSTSWHDPLAMGNGQFIGSPGIWYVGGDLFYYVWGIHSLGNWFVGDDKCLGIKFLISGQYHYGWIHVEIVSPKSLLLKDYAYQLQPNVPMLACDTTNLATGFSEYNHQHFIFSQQNNSIHISTFQNSNHSNISVYDLLGKEILQQPFEGKETTITIDKKGIYFVEVKSEKGIFRKKIFIY